MMFVKSPQSASWARFTTAIPRAGASRRALGEHGYVWSAH